MTSNATLSNFSSTAGQSYCGMDSKRCFWCNFTLKFCIRACIVNCDWFCFDFIKFFMCVFTRYLISSVLKFPFKTSGKSSAHKAPKLLLCDGSLWFRAETIFLSLKYQTTKKNQSRTINFRLRFIEALLFKCSGSSVIGFLCGLYYFRSFSMNEIWILSTKWHMFWSSYGLTLTSISLVLMANMLWYCWSWFLSC